MFTVKAMQGMGSGLLPVDGISPLIPTLFPSLLSLYSSAALLSRVSSLLGWSRHLMPKQGPEGAGSFQGFLTVPKDAKNSSREIGGQ